MVDSDVWIIGSGLMGIEYARALKHLGVPFIAIGRSAQSCERFEEAVSQRCIAGGLQGFLSSNPGIPSHAIVCTQIDELYPVQVALINFGVKKILVEKPGCLMDEFEHLLKLSAANSVSIIVGFNRRYYPSVSEARKMIEEDGGLTSVSFDFTEAIHHVVKSSAWQGSNYIKENWFFCNSCTL